ncbi:alpha/beta hydrolase [Flavobacterium soyangense]|uniref:alpha/beta hydrolase n=1 Tax=Flavobacterium soyangense TaxID=2023265 RepID=UPI00293B973E|nr:alpha/beta hydrolase [Flavobacterium soyangense]
MAIIGSGGIVQDILNNFVAELELKPSTSKQLRLHFEKKYGKEMDNYSAYKSAMKVLIPVLVIQDKNDEEVAVKAGINIHKHLKNGKLFQTGDQGHSKVLANSTVIKKVVQFTKANN